MLLGNKLFFMRKTKYLSMEKIAKDLKVSKKILRNWEKNYSIPSIDKIVLISNLYNVSIEELIKI